MLNLNEILDAVPKKCQIFFILKIVGLILKFTTNLRRIERFLRILLFISFLQISLFIFMSIFITFY